MSEAIHVKITTVLSQGAFVKDIQNIETVLTHDTTVYEAIKDAKAAAITLAEEQGIELTDGMEISVSLRFKEAVA
jgi:hypothetical protein